MDQDLIPQPHRGPLWALAGDGLSIPPVHKANTSEDAMTDDEEELTFDTEPKFDLDKALALLEVVNESRGHPDLKPLFDEASRALSAMAAEITEKIHKEREDKEAESESKPDQGFERRV